MATKRSPSIRDILVLILFWFLFTCFKSGTCSQATPRPPNTSVTGCNEFGSNELCISRSSTIVFSNKGKVSAKLHFK